MSTLLNQIKKDIKLQPDEKFISDKLTDTKYELISEQEDKIKEEMFRLYSKDPNLISYTSAIKYSYIIDENLDQSRFEIGAQQSILDLGLSCYAKNKSYIERKIKVSCASQDMINTNIESNLLNIVRSNMEKTNMDNIKLIIDRTHEKMQLKPLYECYPFLDKFEVCPEIDQATKMQGLNICVKDSKNCDGIYGIYTVSNNTICNFPEDLFNLTLNKNRKLSDDTIKLAKDILLFPLEEKWVAFKSWAQDIAQDGENNFTKKSSDKLSCVEKIHNVFLEFVKKYDSKYIDKYPEKLM